MPQHALWQLRPVFVTPTLRDRQAKRDYLRWGSETVSASRRESKETNGGRIDP
jgi:hypothetical protein